MNSSKLASKIKSLRTKFNLSQTRFGKKIGVTGKAVSSYETGKCIPPLKVLEKMSQTYGETFIAADNVQKDDIADKLKYLKKIVYELEERLVS